MNVGSTSPMRLFTFDAESATIRFLNKATYMAMHFFELGPIHHDRIFLEWLGADDIATMNTCIIALSSQTNPLIIMGILISLFSKLSSSTDKASIYMRIRLSTYFSNRSISLPSIKVDELYQRMKEASLPGRIRIKPDTVVIHRWSMLNFIVISKKGRQYKFSMDEAEINLFMEDANQYDKKWLRDVFKLLSPEALEYISKKLTAFLNSEQDSDKKKAMELFQIFAPLMTQEEIAAFLNNIAMLAYVSETSARQVDNEESSALGLKSVERDKEDIERAEFSVDEYLICYVAEEVFSKTFHYLHDNDTRERLKQQQSQCLEKKLTVVLLKCDISLSEKINALSLDEKLKLFFEHLLHKINKHVVTEGVVRDIKVLSRYLLSYSDDSVNAFLLFLLKVNIESKNNKFVNDIEDVFNYVVSCLTLSTIDNNLKKYLNNMILYFGHDAYASSYAYSQARDALKYFSRLISFVSLGEKIQLLRSVYPNAVNNYTKRSDKQMLDSIQAIVNNIFNSGGEMDLCEIAVKQIQKFKESTFHYVHDNGQDKHDKLYENYRLLFILLPCVNIVVKFMAIDTFFLLLKAKNNACLKIAVLYFYDIRYFGLEKYFFKPTILDLVNTLLELYSKLDKDSETMILNILLYLNIQTVEKQKFLFEQMNRFLSFENPDVISQGVVLLTYFIKFINVFRGSPYCGEICKIFFSDKFRALPKLLGNNRRALLRMVHALSNSDFYTVVSSDMIKAVAQQKSMIVLEILTALIIRNAEVCYQFPALECISRTDKIMLAKTQEMHALARLGVFAYNEHQVDEDVSMLPRLVVDN